MLKRFNENWNSFSDFLADKNKETLQILKDILDDAAILYKGDEQMIAVCKKLLDLGYEVVNFRAIIDKINLSDFDCFYKPKNSNTFRRGYLDMITPAPKHVIPYDDFFRLILKNNKKKEEYNFGNSGDRAVVGLPSGQVIYMNKKQITWFEARKYISFMNTTNIKYSNNISINKKINSYCFDDNLYDNIIELMNEIIW